MLRIALRPRYLGMLAFLLAATVVCGLLASWQWERAHQALVETPEQTSAEARPLGEVLEAGSPVTNEIVGTMVDATGTFAADEQILVPGRRIDGQDVVIVVTALHVPGADGDDARLPVARGWVPEAQVTGADGTVDPSLAPEAPAGEQTISGRLEASEAAEEGMTGPGVAEEISTSLLVNEWGGPMYTGFVAEASPEAGLEPMPVAESAFSRGMNWQNLGYAAQWIVFGGFFLYLWYRAVRAQYLDELAEERDRIREQLATDHPGGEPVGDPADRHDTHAPADVPARAGTSAPEGAEEDVRGADTTAAR
ncbi:MAG: SURF1 family protein [Brachybacterium sp.]|nr:SURF1 family protein [Brachybacterium sp.]